MINRFEELLDVIKTINNSKKIKDISKVVTCMLNCIVSMVMSCGIVDESKSTMSHAMCDCK